MASIFKNFSPKPFGNVNLSPKTNYGRIPAFAQTTGTRPGTAPQVNLVNTVQPFGNPKASLLSGIPSIFRLIHS